MAAAVSFLTPLGGTLALGALVPLLALLFARRRAERVRRIVNLPPIRRRRLVVPVGALLASAGFVGLAAGQPVFEQTNPRQVRTDAEVFFVIDVSRSMLAQSGQTSPTRIERVRALARELRASVPEVPVGIASFTDRALPHLFPSPDVDVFQATLERSVGIERPPPSVSFLTNATKLDALTRIRGLRYFSPTAERRLVVVFTDGESLPVATARLGTLFRRPPAIEAVFVHVWAEDERVFTRGAPEPQYRADPFSRTILDGVAASTGGSVLPEASFEAIVHAMREALGDGPTVIEGARRSQTALAPFFALAAFLPLSILLWQRDR